MCSRSCYTCVWFLVHCVRRAKEAPSSGRDASPAFGALFFVYTGIEVRCSRSCYTCVWLLHKSSISLVCEACLLRSMCSVLIVFEAYGGVWFIGGRGLVGLTLTRGKAKKPHTLPPAPGIWHLWGSGGSVLYSIWSHIAIICIPISW